MSGSNISRKPSWYHSYRGNHLGIIHIEETILVSFISRRPSWYHSYRGDLLGIIQQLMLCQRNDFKSFSIRCDFFLTLFVSNRCLKVRSLLPARGVVVPDLCSKLKNREITVEVDSEDLYRRVEEECENLVPSRPRNAVPIKVKLISITR